MTLIDTFPPSMALNYPLRAKIVYNVPDKVSCGTIDSTKQKGDIN
jgi:hypothetical protein